jgi:hypothetical protein
MARMGTRRSNPQTVTIDKDAKTIGGSVACARPDCDQTVRSAMKCDGVYSSHPNVVTVY